MNISKVTAVYLVLAVACVHSGVRTQHMNIFSATTVRIFANTVVRTDSATLLNGSAVGLESGATWVIGGSLHNEGTFVANEGSTIDFSASGEQGLSGISQLYNLRRSGGGTLSLKSSILILGMLDLSLGYVHLNDHTLTVGASGSISGGSPASYIVTNGNGSLKRDSVGAGERAFPVGPVGSYNPVTISNAGTSDNFAVRVDSVVNPTPNDGDKTVQRTWTISEDAPGGSNVTLVFQWSPQDESSGFLRGNAVVVGRHDVSRWIENAASVSGSNPYVATAGGITTFSPFAVGNAGSLRSVIRSRVRVFLEGPFNIPANQMGNSLRPGVLPSRFPGIPIPTAAVDSIHVEIMGTSPGGPASRNATSEAFTAAPPPVPVNLSRPAWLLTDGSIRGYADTTKDYVEFDTSAGSWHIVIRHRNHLAIMSAEPQALNSNSVLYDFSTTATQAYGTNATKLLGTSYAMYAGDVNSSGIITAADANAVFGQLNQTGYLNGDVNLSGISTAADANMVFGNLNKSSFVPLSPARSSPRRELKLNP